MDYKVTAQNILELIGGKENVASATHCMTRLRLTITDFSLIQDDQIKALPGILGVNRAGSQFQIVVGPQVGDLYKVFVEEAGLDQKAPIPENLDNVPAEKLTPKVIVNKAMDAVSACVTPLIPIITAAGLVKLIVAILGPSMLNIVSPETDLMKLLTLVGDAGFYFFPVYVAYGAAKKFECNVSMSLFLAGIMLHPSLIEIVSAGNPFKVYNIVPMTLVNYSSNFISILLTVWIMSYIEKALLKVIPNALRSLLYPLSITIIMLPLMLCVLGPLGSWIGLGIAAAISALHSFAGPLAIGVVCGLWPLLVATGMHQALIAIAMGNIATYGYDMSITVGGFLSSYPMFALCLVYILKARKEDKGQAVSNFITLAAGGVSEPAIFGMLLKYKKTIGYMFVGGLAAGIYAGLTGVRTYLFGSANVLAALSFAGEYGPSLTNGIIAAVIGFVVTFVIAYIFGIYGKDDA